MSDVLGRVGPVQDAPTFLYRGERFLWGYSADRHTCGLWEVSDPGGTGWRTWPISAHEAAWHVYRSVEPRALKVQDPQSAFSSQPQALPIAPVADVTGAGAQTAAPVSTSGFSYVAPASNGKDRSQRKRLRLLLATAACLLLVAGGFYYVKKHHQSSQAAVDPSAAVLTAVDTAQNDKSAHIDITETVSVPGSTSVTIPASGNVDFTTGAASLTMTFQGQQATVLVDDGTIYVSLPQISQLLPGKDWVSIPAGDSTSAGGGVFASGDPDQMVQMLRAHGNAVTSLGPSAVDGVPVQGYTVTIDKSAVESQLTQMGLPAADIQAVDQMLSSMGPLTYKVYIDNAGRLRAMNFTVGVSNGSQSVVVSAQMTLSNFGAPVTVTPPPSSQVASIQDLISSAGGSIFD